MNFTPHEAAVLPKWVHRVTSCPGNVSQWTQASKKLNCQDDLSSDDHLLQGHQYHCLPSSFLNETVEFCGRSVPLGFHHKSILHKVECFKAKMFEETNAVFLLRFIYQILHMLHVVCLK